MFGLPRDFDTTFLLGRRVEQVRFGPYSVHFDFDERLFIHVESSYLIRKDRSDSGQVEEIPITSSEAMILVGKTIITATAKRDGTLTLWFDSGAVLELYDNQINYESYQIRTSDGGWIIV